MAEKSEVKKEEKSKEKTSIVLFIFLAVAVFAALSYFLVWPQYEKFSQTKNKITAEKARLDDQKATLANINKMIANYEAIGQANREKLASMLPETTDEPGLFVLFEALAIKNKMALLALDISEKDVSADLKNLGVKEVNIAANLTGGGYADFKNLLADLETNLRLMDITAINYTPDPSSLTLNVKTYRLNNSPAK